MGERRGDGIGKGPRAGTRTQGALKRNGSICQHAVHEAIGTDINVTFDQFNAFLLNKSIIIFLYITDPKLLIGSVQYLQTKCTNV